MNPDRLLSLTLLPWALILAACSRGGNYNSPSEPLESPLDGVWQGSVELEGISNVVGEPRTNCAALFLQEKYDRRSPVAMTIRSNDLSFQQLPDFFGQCEGVQNSGQWGQADLYCDFHSPIATTCGDVPHLYLPNWEDDLGFFIESSGDDQISFVFVEAFAPSPANVSLDLGYWVGFRFELSRTQ